MEAAVGRLVDAFKGTPLLAWEASDTPDLAGVRTGAELILAPHRSLKVSTSYFYTRIRGFSTLGHHSDYGQETEEATMDFYLVHDDGLVDPCQVCVHAVARLSGGCTPMGPTCVSHGDNKWI
jgi:hypothetical protein